jgi:hypothetical protein
MTGTRSTQPSGGGGRGGQGSQAGSRRVRALLLAAVAVAVLVAAGGIWYTFFRPAGPAPVGSGAPLIPPGALSSTPAPSSPAGSETPSITLPAVP